MIFSKEWLYKRRLKKARKKALQLSALRQGKKYRVIQYQGRPRLFTIEQIEAFKKAGVFKPDLDAIALDQISLFVTPRLQNNVYYQRGL